MDLHERLDNVYTQRNMLAIAFAKMALQLGMTAGTSKDVTRRTNKTVIYVDLPNGKQVSWHISDADEASVLAAGLPEYTGGWDGTFHGRDPAWINWTDNRDYVKNTGTMPVSRETVVEVRTRGGYPDASPLRGIAGYFDWTITEGRMIGADIIDWRPARKD